MFRCVDKQHFICSPVEGYFGCFNLLAVMNNAAVSIQVQFLWGCVFSSPGYT